VTAVFSDKLNQHVQMNVRHMSDFPGDPDLLTFDRVMQVPACSSWFYHYQYSVHFTNQLLQRETSWGPGSPRGRTKPIGRFFFL